MTGRLKWPSMKKRLDLMPYRRALAEYGAMYLRFKRSKDALAAQEEVLRLFTRYIDERRVDENAQPVYFNNVKLKLAPLEGGDMNERAGDIVNPGCGTNGREYFHA